MSKAKCTTRRKFTRTPTMEELISCGVPLKAVPVYHALSDHCDNKTGKTFVSVATVARILKVCRRTVERHLTALEGAGVIRRQHQRRGRRGRFSSCLCVVISFALFTVRQSGKHGKRSSYKKVSKHSVSTPYIPQTKEEVRMRGREKRRTAFEGYEYLLA